MNKIERQANRAQWERHVVAWKDSGLTQSAYCRVHGLATQTLSAWVYRTKKASKEPAKPLKLVPVVVKESDVQVGLTPSICLQHPSGWQLQLPDGVPAVWLGKVLKEVA